MTSLQIQYWANKERERANRANEAETNRHNLEMEKQGQLSISNLADYQVGQLANTRSQLAELSRANFASEAIRWDQNATQRTNVLGNLAQQEANMYQQQQQFDDKMMWDIDKANREFRERQRQAMAEETLRAAGQAETSRHNQEMEKIGRGDLVIQGGRSILTTIGDLIKPTLR